jgi:uncharacterized protein YjiS (DUF1127 family)
MDTGLRHEGVLTIHPGEVLRLRDAAGKHLSVVHGTVWITQHGDRNDAVLDGGASFRFDRDGLSLVQSLDGAASVVLEEGLTPEQGSRPAADSVEQRAWQLARSEPFQREARRVRAEALASLSDHLLRDLGLRRDQIGFGAYIRECSHC